MTDDAKMVAALDRAWEALDFDRPAWRARRGEKRWVVLRAGEILLYSSDREFADILNARWLL